jgi:hypothetical protein
MERGYSLTLDFVLHDFKTFCKATRSCQCGLGEDRCYRSMQEKSQKYIHNIYFQLTFNKRSKVIQWEKGKHFSTNCVGQLDTLTQKQGKEKITWNIHLTPYTKINLKG